MAMLGGGMKGDGKRDIPLRGKPNGRLSADKSTGGKCGSGRIPGCPAKAALLSETSTELSLLWDSGELMLGELEFL